jgi:hypothetical protein
VVGPSTRFRRPALCGVVVLAGVGAVLGWAAVPGGDAESRPVNLMRFHPARMPGAVDAGAARLPDDAPVIGVAAGGRHRAYSSSAFAELDLHVRNDVLNGVPVTVTYCPRTGCARVYTGPVGGSALAVAPGGWVGEPGDGPDGVMLLRVGTDLYYQDSGAPLAGWGDFPYPEADFERTTWGAWRRSHPDTDVVVGPPRTRAE